MMGSDQLRHYRNLIESIVQSTKTALVHSEISVPSNRRVYRPLRLCNRLCALAQAYTMDRGILVEVEQLDDHPMSALAFCYAGQLFHLRDLTARSRRIFDRLISMQQPSGEFLAPDANANLESRWYEELILLHAAASYAVAEPGDSICRAVEKSAAFHANETQPDHATTEPWGLLAFIQYAPPMADQILHSLSLQYPAGVTGIPLLLLGDVRYGLGRLTKDIE